MVPAREVQSAGTGPVQCPGVPAWPITAPVVGLMNVTEVGWKLGGTCWYGGDWRSGAPPAGGGDAGDVAAGLLRVGDECGRGEAIVVGETLPALTPPAWPREGSRPESACGTVTAPATTTAAPAPATSARLAFRRRAFRLTRSKVPGGGCSGSTSASSQASISSRGSGIALSQRRLQPGPGVVQVGLDRSLRAAQHVGDLADAEPRVVVQQEGAAQPRRQ